MQVKQDDTQPQLELSAMTILCLDIAQTPLALRGSGKSLGVAAVDG